MVSDSLLREVNCTVPPSLLCVKALGMGEQAVKRHICSDLPGDSSQAREIPFSAKIKTSGRL